MRYNSYIIVTPINPRDGAPEITTVCDTLLWNDSSVLMRTQFHIFRDTFYT